ncbi:MAG: TRAM domain-containing protein, partial [Candidatus Coatesbacteria bacterium]|nr:TRAM domain-containing protein [Candidatus Coatesbacteria bacterium]
LSAAARERVPDITLTTDVIVGFPGENEDDHRATLELLEGVGFDNAFMFKFSPREGTRATELPDDVPPEVKQRRFLEVQAIIESSAKDRNTALVGKHLEVVIEGTDKTGRPFGRTPGGKILKLAAGTAVEPGEYVTARVEAASVFSLEGAVVNEA